MLIFAVNVLVAFAMGVFGYFPVSQETPCTAVYMSKQLLMSFTWQRHCCCESVMHLVSCSALQLMVQRHDGHSSYENLHHFSLKVLFWKKKTRVLANPLVGPNPEVCDEVTDLAIEHSAFQKHCTLWSSRHYVHYISTRSWWQNARQYVKS